MKKKSVLIFVCALFAIKALAQQKVAPGGVKGAVVWFVTDSTSGSPQFISKLERPDSVLSLAGGRPTVMMNFHPALVFDGAATLAINMPDSGFNSATFFSVYHSKSPDAESTVWYMARQNKTQLVSTTSRMADLESIKYLNFRDLYPSDPKIAAYSQQKLKDTVSPSALVWHIGSKPQQPVLPVNSFFGSIPEVIAYNRVLSTEERLKVGSYLAIKYGITLSEPGATYLNSAGNVLWDGLSYTNYFHNIAGLARDDSSSLAQQKATSSNTPGLLTITATQKLGNYTSMLWGDNDRALTADEKIPGQPVLLKRKWLMFTRNNGQPLLTHLAIDTKTIDVDRPPHPVYRLVIDTTGTGDFSLRQTQFIPMSNIDKDGIVHFDNVAWGGGQNNITVMGLSVAQAVLATSTITQPVCNEPNSGRLSIKIIGGLAPFNVRLVKDSSKLIAQKTFNMVITDTLNNIGAGKYKLTVTDAAGQTYTDNFYVNPSDAPQPVFLASSYTLPASGQLVIRADSLMQQSLLYEWHGPNGFYTNQPAPTITKPGTYTLTCTLGLCSYQTDILVRGQPTDYFSENNVIVYPNPSNGAFSVAVSLDKPGAVKMFVRTTTGTTLGQPQQGTGMAHYTFSGNISSSGFYLLEFQAGKYRATKKLVILN